jgi:hypothetical protein
MRNVHRRSRGCAWAQKARLLGAPCDAMTYRLMSGTLRIHVLVRSVSSPSKSTAPTSRASTFKIFRDGPARKTSANPTAPKGAPRHQDDHGTPTRPPHSRQTVGMAGPRQSLRHSGMVRAPQCGQGYDGILPNAMRLTCKGLRHNLDAEHHMRKPGGDQPPRNGNLAAKPQPSRPLVRFKRLVGQLPSRSLLRSCTHQ